MTWAAQALRLLEACRAELAACTADSDRGLERLGQLSSSLNDHLHGAQRPRPQLEAMLTRSVPLMEAVAALNAALKQPLRPPAAASQLLRRSEVAGLVTVIVSAVVRSMLALPVHLTLPEATLAALAAGAALSLEAGAATVAELWAWAQQAGDHQLKYRASASAEQHVHVAGYCALSAHSSMAPQGWGQAAAPLLAPPALLELLEAAVPPLLWTKQFCQQRPEIAIDSFSWLQEMVRALYRDEASSAGGLALACRPVLQRGLAQLVAASLSQLAPMRHMQRNAPYVSAVINGLNTMSLLGYAGDSAAPWAGWIAQHAAAAVVEIGVQRPPGVDGVQHKQLLFKATAGALVSSRAYFVAAMSPGAAVETSRALRVPRPTIDALTQVVALLMVAVQEESRFKGVERVLEGFANAPAPSIWDEGPPAAAPTEFATAAEVCAALEMAARLLAVLPEVFERLPRELQDVSFMGASGQLADQLWTTLYYGCPSIAYLQLTGDPAAGAAATGDLLASVAKLQGAASRFWPFPVQAQELKASLLMFPGASRLLGKWFHALPPPEGPGGDGPAPMFVAALIAAVQGMRTVLDLPSIRRENESRLLHLVVGLLFHDLCSEAAFVRVVSERGGFALLEAQVARVFDPNLPGAVDSTRSLGNAVAALEQLNILISKQTQLGFELNAILASTSVPAALAAWAAAALRAGHRAAVTELAPLINSVLAASWTQQQCSTAAPSSGAAQYVRLLSLPGSEIAMQGGGHVWSAAQYERMAADILPQGALRLRTLRAEEAARPEVAQALTLDEARALATRPCANPLCVKIVGCREREARGRRCSGCMVSRYCCRECQVAGWRAHKGVCGALGAEREASAAEA